MTNPIKINYVCEVNFPNTSAYSIHVMKMCDALQTKDSEVNLICPSLEIDKKKLKKNYKTLNNFKIRNVFKKKTQMNFFSRVFFSVKILTDKSLYLDNFNYFYLSRSIIFAIVASLFNKKVILEIHHELSGATKLIYYILRTAGLLNNLNYIFIHKNLIKIFKIKKGSYICLDDAVKVEDFDIKKKKLFKKTCIYIGSFHKGKGVEKIVSIAKKMKDVNFHLYGDRYFLKKNYNIKNLKFFEFIPYKKVPEILSKYKIALMPYSNYVQGRSKNTNLVNYMSPLKMFDYLAASKIILASDLKVYKHILKNKHNSILIQNDTQDWMYWIDKIFKSKSKFKYLEKNAKKTAMSFTWKIRSKKIIFFAKKIFNT